MPTELQSRKRDVLRAAKAAGLFGVARTRSARALRILCYHGLWHGDPAFRGDSLFMLPATFHRRVELIRALGYPVVSLEAAIAALQGLGPALPPAALVITLDDGWASTASEMLPAFEALGMPVTLYCDTAQLISGQPSAHLMALYMDKVAAIQPASTRLRDIDLATASTARRVATDLSRPVGERAEAATALGEALGLNTAASPMGTTFDYVTPDALAAAHSRGLDVQLHTHNHSLGDMSPAAIESEVRQNRQALSQILNRPPESFKQFCYPRGLTSPEAPQILAALGVESSTTCVPGLAWPGSPMHMLPRLLDGENLSEIEFEAELSGFGDWLRAGKNAARRLTGRHQGPKSSNVLAPAEGA